MSQPYDSDPSKNLELMGQPQAIHAALEGIVTIDDQMRIIMINPAALRMFGHTEAEMIGQPMSDLMPERFRAAHQLHVRKFVESDLMERAMGPAGSLVGLRASGEEFPLKAAICKVELETEHGRQKCCTALIFDCSNEVELSRAIGKLNQQMRAVFELAPIAIWITDGDSIVFANEACIRLFGVKDSNALVGCSIRDLIQVNANNSDFEWSQGNSSPNENLAMLNGKIARPDGSIREVEIAVTPLPDHGRSFVQMVIVDSTLRSRERRSLLHSKHTLRALAANIVEAREEERQHIARELHDELGQRLTALKMELAASARNQVNDSASDRHQHMMDMVDETMKATRHLAMGLRPPMLDDLGLESAMDWLVRQFMQNHAIKVDLQIETLQAPLPPSVSVSLYRILQEALTNIARHSSAQQVHIDLKSHGQWIQLVVQDDGQGLPEQDAVPKRSSFGLIGMRERVRMHSGQFQFRNAVHGGARLVVRLPLTNIDTAHFRLPVSESAPPPDSDFSPLTHWEGS